jgi:GAF domain-containing protein
MSVGDDARHRVNEFAQLAQALAAAPNEDARLQLVVDSAVTLLRRVDHAGITINAKPGLATRVTSDDVVTRANEMQNEMGEGPCLDVLRDADILVSPDLTQEQRWPRWAARVHHELGVNSVMSLLVYTHSHSFGALSLYAQQGKRFDEDDLTVSQSLAGHLAVIMAAEREIEQLGSALHTRIIIGQAEGILMERLELEVDQAFDYLRRVSSHTNRKLVDIASEIVRTRKLPDLL